MPLFIVVFNFCSISSLKVKAMVIITIALLVSLAACPAILLNRMEVALRNGSGLTIDKRNL
jgi:hypothetical protein